MGPGSTSPKVGPAPSQDVPHHVGHRLDLRLSPWRDFRSEARGVTEQLNTDLLAADGGGGLGAGATADIRRRGVQPVVGARASQCDALLTPRLEAQMALRLLNGGGNGGGATSAPRGSAHKKAVG